MASVLKVDELQGIVSAGDITVTSEGGSATQSLQQGLAKAWACYSSEGIPVLLDSFNVASTTDVGTGRFRFTFTNAMSNSNYSSSGNSNISGHYLATGVDNNGSAQQTTAVDKWLSRTDTGALIDTNQVSAQIHGDLA